MKESLQQKIIESQSSINEIAALLEKDFSSKGIVAFFRGKGVELSADEADEFLAQMQEAKEAASSVELSDDALAAVSGGVEQVLDDLGNAIDTGRYLACKAAPFLAGCDRIIKLYENRGF